ncbi:MAG: DNA polymerase III subunit delta [Nitriliruptor sp.]
MLDQLREQDDDLTVEVHDVAETDHLPELRTASLFGGRTCVVLRGVEGVSGDLKAEIESYLEAPSDDAVLVLVVRGIGKVQRIAKLAKQHGERSDVKVPADWDERGWDRLVGEEFRRLKRKADASAIAALRAHAGTVPGVIASKVAQVCAAEPSAPTLTAAHVEASVEGHGKVSGFTVADAVADRDPGEALVALRGALESGEAPLALLGAITFRFRQLLQIRGGGDAKSAGVSPNQFRRLQGIAGRFGPGELAWCHDRLAQLDVDLKGSELPAPLVLEIGVLELATSRDVGRPFNPLATR